MKVIVTGPDLEQPYIANVTWGMIDAPTTQAQREAGHRQLAIELGIEDGAFTQDDVPTLKFQFFEE